MRQNIHRRVTKLEQFCAAREPKKSDAGQFGYQFTAWVRESLQVCEFEQRPDESLASAFARLIGISYEELKQRLRVKAYGS